MSSRHVALLRGVNVGSAKRVAMADLRALVEDLGFRNVRTLLNSGNIVYTSPRSTPAVAARRIESAIAKTLGVSSKVTVVDSAELGDIVSANPLESVADDHSRMLVYVLATTDACARVRALAGHAWGKERVAVGKRVVYAWCPHGFMESKLRAALDRALGDAATTRNWATMMRLDALVKSV